MGRKKRNASAANPGGGPASNMPDAKRTKPETGEVYLVKKYRAEKNYASMEAFVRYTKSHRMLDASYVRWNTGVTTEKPFVFSTRVGGTDLGWGRGKSKEAAMDCACRATFALVSAHGYKHFTLDDDCLLEAPVDSMPPPPPPPPPPMLLGVPPLPPPPGSYHPLPPPLPVSLPPPPTVADIIPQPKLQDQLPTATAAASQLNNASGLNPEVKVSLTLSTSGSANNNNAGSNNNNTGAITSTSATTSSQKLKGGLILVFSSEDDNDISMEEKRASLPRYQKMLIRAALKSGGK